ncbi:MAG: hypothetical protein L6R43_16405 [Planctomycetes bacterium]|nr:hypothetical protein [Planctomycetota bacterium]
MRYGPKDPFWMVTNPTPNSELVDICFETSLENLALQVKGGLSMDADPTLFTDRAEAEVEARCRLVARETSAAIRAMAADGVPLAGARKVQVLGEGGKVLFETDIE